MRIRTAAIGIAVCLFVAVAGGVRQPLAQGVKTRPHCANCKRFTDTSPSRVDAIYDFGKRKRIIECCSIFCYFEIREDYPDKEPVRARIVNYNSIDTEIPLMINLDRAHYVMVPEADAEKASEPYIFGFATSKEAEEAKQELGGEMLDWEEVSVLCCELAEEYEPENPHFYRPKKQR